MGRGNFSTKIGMRDQDDQKQLERMHRESKWNILVV